jgi:DNA-binding response OmpR family regulator
MTGHAQNPATCRRKVAPPSGSADINIEAVPRGKGMNRKRILIVDDEPYLTSLVAQALKKRGHAPEVARDGKLGLAAARREPADLIITDFQMPACDGLSMAKQLKASSETADVPIIMLTGRGHRISPTEQAQTNIKAMVPKPFSMRELLARVDETLQENKAA